MTSKHASRKQSQRLFSEMKPCERCGSTNRVQRHHEDYDKPDEVMFLCQPCHTARHVERGDWANHRKINIGPTRFKTPKTCALCGKTFANYSHSRVKLCSPECVKEQGRINAMKRWHPERVAS